MRFIFLLLIACFGPQISSAQVACRRAWLDPSIADYLHSDRIANQNVLLKMQSPLFQRFLRDPEVKLLAIELHQSAEAHLDLNVAWENSNSNILKIISEGNISYNVKSIFVKEDGALINTGHRPRSINMEFPKILTAVLEAAKNDIQTNPQAQTFQLTAGNVVNPMLIKMLKEYGFQMQQEHTAVAQVPTMLDATGPRAYPNFRRPLHQPHNEVGQNWVMNFTIKKN